MAWGAIISGIASIAGGYLSSRGSDDAADAAERSGLAAVDFQRELLATSIALSRPQLEVANGALGLLAGLFGIPQPTPIDFDSIEGGLSGQQQRSIHPLYGDGNRPLDEEGIKQAYRDVLGREADAGGLQYYLTQGPKERASTSLADRTRGFSEGSIKGLATGSFSNSALGGILGGSKDNRRRRAFTFNEFLRATKTTQDYRDRVASGAISENQDFLAIPEPEPAQSNSTTSQGLSLEQLVNQNPLIQLQRTENERFTSRAAAARGLNQSGGTLRELQDRNSQITAAGAQNLVINPLFQLAGFGPQAAAQLNQTSSNVAGNLANIAIGTGAARASAFQNSANALGNSVNDAGQTFWLQQLINNQGGRG